MTVFALGSDHDFGLSAALEDLVKRLCLGLMSLVRVGNFVLGDFVQALNLGTNTFSTLMPSCPSF